MKRAFAQKKVNVAFALVGLLGFVGSSSAFATQQFSSIVALGTTDGYTYQNVAGIDNTNLDAFSVMESTSGNAPAGYMGADGRLYGPTSGLCEDGGWVYNNAATNQEEGHTTFGSYCGTGNYYSYGYTRAYNGNGYNTKGTDKSPYLPFP